MKEKGQLFLPEEFKFINAEGLKETVESFAQHINNCNRQEPLMDAKISEGKFKEKQIAEKPGRQMIKGNIIGN